MEAKRDTAKAQQLRSARQQSAREPQATRQQASPASSAPGSGRTMQPFFAPDDAVPSATLETHKPSSRKSHNKSKAEPRRLAHKANPLPKFSDREVGISTLPIGHFHLAANPGKPINVDLAQLKNVGIKVTNRKNVFDNFDKLSDSKCDSTDYNDANSEKMDSHRTISTSLETFCNIEYEEIGNEANDAHHNHAGGDDASSPIEILRRLSRSTAKGAPPKQIHKTMVDAKTSSSNESNRLKAILKRMGMLPSVRPDQQQQLKQQQQQKQNHAYAFSKYVCSPDPSSIPIPGLR